MVARLSSLNPGCVNNMMVCEGFQNVAEEVVQPQRVSVASEVLSKTLTSAFSAWLPSLVVTLLHLVDVRLLEERLAFLSRSYALDAHKYLPFSSIISTFDKGF